MAPTRPNQFKMMLSDEELEKLRELAEAKGLTASDYLRTLIREQSAAPEEESTFASLARTFERLGALGAGQPAARARAVAKKLRRGEKKTKR